jgi:predicted tellurium resistance membrane protein TerC
LVERFPLIIQAGAAVLAFTAARMIVGEPLLIRLFEAAPFRWAAYAVAVAGVLAAGWWHARRHRGAYDDHDGDASRTSRGRTGHTA